MNGFNGRLSELIYKYPRQVGQNKSICIPLSENEKFRDWLYSTNEDDPTEDYPIDIREIRLEFFAEITCTKRYCDERYIIRELCMLHPAGNYTYIKRMLFENPRLWTFDELIQMSHNECNIDDVVNEILHLWYDDFDKDYKFSYYIKPHTPVIHTD
jgi:hypothetical protein